MLKNYVISCIYTVENKHKLLITVAYQLLITANAMWTYNETRHFQTSACMAKTYILHHVWLSHDTKNPLKQQD